MSSETDLLIISRRSGAWVFADGQICGDGEDMLDREQGVPHLEGFPCRVARCEDPRVR